MIEDDAPDRDWTEPGVFRCAPGVHRIPLPLPQDGLRAVNVYAVDDGAGWCSSTPAGRSPQARELLERGAGGARRTGSATCAGSWSPTSTATTTRRRSPLRREFGTKGRAGARASSRRWRRINTRGRRRSARAVPCCAAAAGRPTRWWPARLEARREHGRDWEYPDDGSRTARILVGAARGSCARSPPRGTPRATWCSPTRPGAAVRRRPRAAHDHPVDRPAAGPAPPLATSWPRSSWCAAARTRCCCPRTAPYRERAPAGRRAAGAPRQAPGRHTGRRAVRLLDRLRGGGRAAVDPARPAPRRPGPVQPMLATTETLAHLDVLAERGL